MHVSFVLATHNRREIVIDTLTRLSQCGLDRSDFEIIAVDNASTDGTPDAIEGLVDQVIRLSYNGGSCAKAHGVPQARGRYVVFLDDDSFPRAGSVVRMLERFDALPRLGAAGFAIHLPDGRQEGSALPDVFVGCGVGFRAEALRGSGGLDATFFMQAEEYDLTFRLVSTGWEVRTFEDLHVEHLKSIQARRSERTAFYDVRNNLRVAARYLPKQHYRVYRDDWARRYQWLAQSEGHTRAWRRGERAGRWRGRLERRPYRCHRLTVSAAEYFFRWDQIERAMSRLVRTGARRIVLADLGKNVYAYYRAAREVGLDVLAIGDDRFAAPKRTYRSVPVLRLDAALALDPDTVVVANTSTVHGTNTYKRVSAGTSVPVHHWFHPVVHKDRVGIDSFHTVLPVDQLEEAVGPAMGW